MILASHYDPWWLVLFQAILVLGFLVFMWDTLLDFISRIVRGVILIGKAVRGDVTYQGFDGYSGAEPPSQARRGVPVDAWDASSEWGGTTEARERLTRR